jgi:ribosomal protein S6--L-glutamate ligase
MKAAVISQGSISSEWVVEALKRYFDDVDDLNIKNIEVNTTTDLGVLYKGKPLENYDCVYIKGSFRYQPIARAIATAIYGKTYTPITPAAITIGHDKILTQLELQKKKIPMPKTYLASSADAARRILEKVNYPIVMKFPSGTQGKGVMVADSYASASSMMDALSALKQPFLIQEYVETGGIDTRAIVVGDKVVAAMHRESKKGEVRANIHAGGSGKCCELDAKTKKIAVDAAKIIGADVCAVDILEGVKGPLVIEINLSPGLQGITKATKIDVADKIASFLYEKAKSLKDSGAQKIMTEVGIKTDEKLKEIITQLDFRGDRILLPSPVTALTKFEDKEEYIIKAEKGSLSVKKLNNENLMIRL